MKHEAGIVNQQQHHQFASNHITSERFKPQVNKNQTPKKSDRQSLSMSHDREEAWTYNACLTGFLTLSGGRRRPKCDQTEVGQ
jgi:hypothetical protein